MDCATSWSPRGAGTESGTWWPTSSRTRSNSTTTSSIPSRWEGTRRSPTRWCRASSAREPPRDLVVQLRESLVVRGNEDVEAGGGVVLGLHAGELGAARERAQLAAPKWFDGIGLSPGQRVPRKPVAWCG